MKKLIALVLTLTLSLVCSVAFAGDEPVNNVIVDTDWMSEQLANVVGYKPYVVEVDLGEGEQEWLFIMHDTSILAYVTGEDFESFLEFAGRYQFDWYEELPEYVSISEEEEIRVGKGLVYLDTFFATDSNLVLGYEAYNLWLEEDQFSQEDGVYTFGKQWLAQLVYENEMSHIQYVGDLLDEVR